MKWIFSIQRVLDSFVTWFYWIIMMLYIVEVPILSFSATTAGGILLLLIGIMFLISKKGSLQASHIYVYFFILIGSGFLYIIYDLPIRMFFSGLVYCVLPMVMYVVSKNDVEKITNRAFAAILFSLALSYALYLWGPSFFGEYLVKHNYIRKVNQVSSSLQGLYGITAVGTYSACSTLFFYGRWVDSGNNKFLIATAFSAFILLVSMRRSAVASCILMLLVEIAVFILLYKKNQHKQLKLLGLLVVLFLLFLVIKRTYVLQVISKIANVSTAIAERSGNWAKNYEVIKDHLLFGTGVGSGGHIASTLGYIGVHDNSYLLIIRENGVIGLLAFATVVLVSSYRFFRNKSKTITNYVAFFIVCIFMIQAVGSNVWEFPFSASLFWLMLSICGIKYENASNKIA